MFVLTTVLLVFFIIIAILLVLLVLIQNDEGGGLGGMFGGGSNTAFGSRSGNVLTRATTVLGSLFLIISLGLALISRTQGGRGVEEAAAEIISVESESTYLDAIRRSQENDSPPSDDGLQFNFDNFNFDTFNLENLNFENFNIEGAQETP
ncbi:MAG: preprotein translocase subunit SecG [Treponema sp.]|nr:preprotein translocase subunit SecG [Treponema sp.]